MYRTERSSSNWSKERERFVSNVTRGKEVYYGMECIRILEAIKMNDHFKYKLSYIILESKSKSAKRQFQCEDDGDNDSKCDQDTVWLE